MRFRDIFFKPDPMSTEQREKLARLVEENHEAAERAQEQVRKLLMITLKAHKGNGQTK